MCRFYEFPFIPNVGSGFRTLSALGFEEFLRKTCFQQRKLGPKEFISDCRMQQEVELAKMNFVDKIKA
jgi:hypothetical protein